MMIYYDKENQFELTDEEFKKALPAFDSGKNVWIERLQVHLTPYYKWAGRKPLNPNVGYAREDGRKMIKRFGEWRCADDPDLKINTEYYKSVAKDDLILEGSEEDIKFIEDSKKLLK